MNQGVRAAVIATKDQSILLVRHVHPTTAKEWWVPPGGGLEDMDDSIQACAAREVAEETGLIPVVGRLVYVREFRETDRYTRWAELYFLADELEGILTAEHLTEERPGEKYIREARWLARNELEHRNVFPEILRDQFWLDLKAGSPQAR